MVSHVPEKFGRRRAHSTSRRFSSNSLHPRPNRHSATTLPSAAPPRTPPLGTPSRPAPACSPPPPPSPQPLSSFGSTLVPLRHVRRRGRHHTVARLLLHLPLLRVDHIGHTAPDQRRQPVDEIRPRTRLQRVAEHLEAHETPPRGRPGAAPDRSEERRVGKEASSRWAAEQQT